MGQVALKELIIEDANLGEKTFTILHLLLEKVIALCIYTILFLKKFHQCFFWRHIRSFCNTEKVRAVVVCQNPLDPFLSYGLEVQSFRNPVWKEFPPGFKIGLTFLPKKVSLSTSLSGITLVSFILYSLCLKLIVPFPVQEIINCILDR